MKAKILALTDYKNRFGSKHFDKPYRSGMNKNLLQDCFNECGFEIEFVQFTELVNRTNIPKDCYYIYTSSEDQNYLYKNFIEDQILYLQESGCKVIPEYKYLRANNNKVFMELLRKSTGNNQLQSISSFVFGTKEEAMAMIDKYTFPVVIKKSEGACGRGVFKANNKIVFEKILSKIAASKSSRHDLKEIGRSYKHKGYLKESRYRSKFVIQNMIQGLLNDWKVLVYDNRCYVLYRGIRNNDFRASGSGNFEFRREIPKGMLDFALLVKEHFNVPHISLDIGFDGETFHLIEFQFLYFGTTTIEKAPFYFARNNNDWILKEGKSQLELVYADSIINFIKEK